jgi:hypothetical protein
MIVNNMLLRLKKHDDEGILKASQKLVSMRGRIPYLVDIQVHSNIRRGAEGYDLSVTAKYNSMKDFESYLTHPVHVEVSGYIGGVVESVAAVTYEI